MKEYKTKTISGPIASFSDGLAGSTCKEVICNIHSKQDLNGYDKPWAGGCNVNQWKPISGTHRGITFSVEYDGTVTISGTMESDGWPMVSEDYTLASFGVSIGDSLSVYSDGDCLATVRFYDSNSVMISQIKSGETGTVPNETETITLVQIGKGGATAPVTGDTISTVGKFEVDISSSAITDWTPWANVCPIVGNYNLFIENCGKNVIDFKWCERTTSSGGITSTFQDDGSIRCIGTATSTSSNITGRFEFPIKKEISFILSRTEVVPTSTSKEYFVCYDMKFNIIGNRCMTNAGALMKKWDPRDQDMYVYLSLSAFVKETTYDFNIHPMLEVAHGNIATRWEPYKGDHIYAMFPSRGKNLLSMGLYSGGKYGPFIGDHWDLRKSAQFYKVNPDGSFTFTTTSSRQYYIFLAPIEPGKKYNRYFKLIKHRGAFRFSYGTLDKNFNVLSVSNSTPSAAIGVEWEYDVTTTYSASNPYAYTYFVFTNYTTANSSFTIINPQVTQGNHVDYEPCTCIYEGSYSSNGTVTRTHDSIIFDGSEDENWTSANTGNIFRYGIIISDAKYPETGRMEVLSNEGLYSSSGNSVGNIFIANYNNKARLYFIPPQTITTVADFKTWLASNPLQVKYELAEPVTSPATRNLITLVDSEVNNIYCDAGDVTVEYYDGTEEVVVEEYLIKGETLTRIADSIRTVKGTQSPIDVDDFIDEIDNMNVPLPDAEEVEF